MSAEVSNVETKAEQTAAKSTDLPDLVAHAAEDADYSDMLLTRLKHNSVLYPEKTSMAFIVPSNSGAATKISISQERTYAQLESESTLLAISLLEKYKIKKGDRYV